MAKGDIFKPRRKKKREATCESRSNDYAESLGWRHRKMNGLGNMSWPDRIYLPPKAKPKRSKGIDLFPQKMRPFWVEFKREGEEATESQALLHKDLQARGEDVLVLDNFKDFKHAIDQRTF